MVVNVVVPFFAKMATSSERSFGSFHSSNLKEQLDVPEDKYQPPPPPPVEFPKFSKRAEFGADMKDKHFYLDKDWAFINHGAFGAVIKEALEAQRVWQNYVERQPVRFLDREFFPYLVETIIRVAKFIDCAKTDVVFIQNATTGTNAVVQSVVKTLKPGDSILMTNFTYKTLKYLLKNVGQHHEIKIDEVKIEFPITSMDHVVKLIEDSITPSTKFAVLDHMPSSNALLLPIKEMVAACHKRGVQVLVDGAHCFGSIPISMRDIGADYYVANAHKWLCSPKGCAILYVDHSHANIVMPLLVSWGHGFGFNSEFAWTGLMDYTPYLSMNTVLDFWEFYGPDEIRAYIYDTAKAAGMLLTKSWQSSLLADVGAFRQMVTVALPEGVVPKDALPSAEVTGQKPKYIYKHAVLVQNALHYGYKIEVPVKAIQGKLFVRVAAHVYNDMSDYQRLADAVNKLKQTNGY